VTLLLGLTLQLGSALGAIPPLMPAADAAQPGLHAWWREGELLLGVPSAAERPAMRPLVDLAHFTLPTDFSGWEPIGKTCQADPRASAALEQVPIECTVTGTAIHPVIRLVQGTRVLAESALGRPAKVCEIRIVQADDMPGLELIVAWQMGKGETQVNGFNIFRIPEAMGVTSPASIE
jgi:hypothetical protein